MPKPTESGGGRGRRGAHDQRSGLLNKSPLLINKIVAERLSDKIQVVMVPSDGKFFFASDVFKSAATNPIVKQEMDSEQDSTGQKNGQ